jgi:hypothetical protein
LNITTIEIIAIGKEKVYSVGSMVVSESGDVYFNHCVLDSDFHLSRHASGETHWKSEELRLSQYIRKGQPIKEFKGIEFLQTVGFGVDSLPEVYKEYQLKKNDGVFCIDMRQYKGVAFNMFLYMITEEGLPALVSETKLLNRQISIFPDCHPMIAIVIGEAPLKKKS